MQAQQSCSLWILGSTTFSCRFSLSVDGQPVASQSETPVRVSEGVARRVFNSAGRTAGLQRKNANVGMAAVGPGIKAGRPASRNCFFTSSCSVTATSHWSAPWVAGERTRPRLKAASTLLRRCCWDLGSPALTLGNHTRGERGTGANNSSDATVPSPGQTIAQRSRSSGGL